jgi:hypothetical protein
MGNAEQSIPTTPNAIIKVICAMYINGVFSFEDLKTILIMGIQKLLISERLLNPCSWGARTMFNTGPLRKRSAALACLQVTPTSKPGFFLLEGG